SRSRTSSTRSACACSNGSRSSNRSTSRPTTRPGSPFARRSTATRTSECCASRPDRPATSSSRWIATTSKNSKQMAAELTTHVRDTSREGPAEGVTVTLQRLDSDGDAETLADGTTNDDGRLDEPLLTPDEMEAGTYQLQFDVGDYYRRSETGSTFLETVQVRFVIEERDEHYHVPLLLSPGGYTTYR